MEEWVTVFAGPSVRAGLLQSLLESHGLTVVVQDQHMSVLEPWIAVGAGVGSAKLAVPASQAERARQILHGMGA